jgi:4a-hydroxytetrahydrobiopterin dehydratase
LLCVIEIDGTNSSALERNPLRAEISEISRHNGHMARLTDDEVQARLTDVPGWELVDGTLHREVQLRNFVEAFGFMTKVALEAEKLDHHPDWSNSWNKVVLDVVSHAEGGLTDQCFRLAAAVNRALGE